MSGNVYMQWVWAHFASIRATLISLATLFAFVGLVTSLTGYWPGAATASAAAFLCKWVECWLLEKALIECQEAL